jgi:hypothetical protein
VSTFLAYLRQRPASAVAIGVMAVQALISLLAPLVAPRDLKQRQHRRVRRTHAGHQMSYGILGNCGKYPTRVTLNSLMCLANTPVLKGSAAPILDWWTKAIDTATPRPLQTRRRSAACRSTATTSSSWRTSR